MKIIVKKIADLKPYEKNARKHPQKQIDLLARNQEEYVMVWKLMSITVMS